MDNAGGHGTDEAVKSYTEMLKSEYTIEIIQQVPRSPETNMLDLGLWRSMQSAVEKEHAFKVYDADALNRSVEKAWNDRLKPEVFKRVYERLRKVLKLIESDNGDNNEVESKRGKKFFSDPLFAPKDDDESDEGDDDMDIQQGDD